MATTPATLRPPTIASVLASTSVGTPAASSGSSTAAANQAQFLANQKAAAEREARRQAAINGTTYAPGTNFGPGGGLGGGDDSSPSIDYGGKVAVGARSDYTGSAVKNPVTVNTVTSLTQKPVTINKPPVVSQKVQVGKLVSDFKVGMGSSGGDRTKYYNNINYNSLSPNAKVVADRLFDGKKKDEDLTTAPTSIPRTGLKTVTPTTQADSVAGIRAANPGMSILQARDEAEKRRLARVIDTTTTPADKDTTYIGETKDVIDTIKAQNEVDKKDQLDAAEENKRLAEEYNNSMITDHQNALTTFENDQNALVSQYEGNRLNQVQGDLRRVLLERGVDVSKVTPEQLIALSGSVGVNAFNDISSAKEKAKASIETARQNALSKISQLKANNVLNETQYNTAIADINSKSAAANNNLDLKFAELKFGVATNKDATQKTDAQNAVANILSTAQALGVTGTQMGLVQQFIANAKTTPEALNRMLSELQNPNSPLYTTLKSNEAASAKKAQFDAALKQYEAETDRIKADASMTSANRPRSSGSTKTQVEPI